MKYKNIKILWKENSVRGTDEFSFLTRGIMERNNGGNEDTFVGNSKDVRNRDEENRRKIVICNSRAGCSRPSSTSYYRRLVLEDRNERGQAVVAFVISTQKTVFNVFSVSSGKLFVSSARSFA